MKCEEIRAKLVDLWGGALDTRERAEVQGHLDACFDCSKEAADLSLLWSKLAELPEAEPSPALKARFEVMLEAYQAGLKQAAPALLERLDSWFAVFFPRRPAFQAAFALACLVLGGGLGLWMRAGGEARGPIEATSDVQSLTSEVRELRTLVAVSLLQQQSPAERLRGVSFSYRVAEPRPAVLDALLETLDRDPNVNVRLAAVDALTRFSEQETVRASLVRSLGSQESPLVQIALIDLMVEIREKKSLDAMRALYQNKELHPAVRERAEWAVAQIS